MLRRAIPILVLSYLIFAIVWVIMSGFSRTDSLLNVSCDPTRELWRDLNDAFSEEYARETGVKPVIRQSHGGSGSQARSVIDGLPADVVTLGLWSDTNAIHKAGLINDKEWEKRLENRSLPYVSTIVFVVRKGNPKNIRDWPDLVKDDVQIITPGPKTSGNGKWSFLALWGSVVVRGGTEEQAREYLTEVYRRVPVLDASARAATMTFAEKKIGDVHLTWENEAYMEVHESEGALEIVHPSISVLAEAPVAVVDSVVDRKGTRAIAEAYMKFLYTERAQEIIAKHHLRPTHPEVVKRTRERFGKLTLFPVTQVAKDWDEVQTKFFREGGLFDEIYRKRK